jgi:hypothetical protein
MAKGTRKTATKRAGTTSRGRGGRGGGGSPLVSYNIPKMEARGIIQGWNQTGKLLGNLMEKHRELETRLQPLAKLHGLEIESSGTQTRTRATRKSSTRRTTTARTGRGRSTQQEQQTATA